MKFFISVFLSLVITFSFTPFASASAATVTAVKTPAKVLVNGAEKSFDAYNIAGRNYFMLRDIAYVISGTSKQFDVAWDASRAIILTSHKAYTITGGEMAQGTEGNKTALAATQKVILDNKEVQMEAYNIGGRNYFRLVDLGAALDISVEWDGASNTVIINTEEKSYLFFGNNKLMLQRGVWGDALDHDVLVVLEAVLDTYGTVFGMDYMLRSPGNTRIEPSPYGHPKTMDNHLVIYLSATDSHWCWYMYQFGHELFHFAAQNNSGYRHQWFEEALAHMGSLYVLDTLKEAWKAEPPGSYRYNYADAITEYYNKTLEDSRLNYTKHELAALRKEKDTDLEKDPYYGDRKIINAIAVCFYEEVFKGNTAAWGAFKTLSEIGPADDLTFDEYLNLWFTTCENRYQVYIKKIADILEVKLG